MLSKLLNIFGSKKSSDSNDLPTQLEKAGIEIDASVVTNSDMSEKSYKYHHTFLFSGISDTDLDLIEKKIAEYGADLGLPNDGENPSAYIIDTFAKFTVPAGADSNAVESLKEKISEATFNDSVNRYIEKIEKLGLSSNRVKVLLENICSTTDNEGNTIDIGLIDYPISSPQDWYNFNMVETSLSHYRGREEQFLNASSGKELYELVILHFASNKKLNTEDNYSDDAINTLLVSREGFIRDLFYDFEDEMSFPFVRYVDNEFRLWEMIDMYKSVTWECDTFYSKNGPAEGWLNDSGIGLN